MFNKNIKVILLLPMLVVSLNGCSTKSTENVETSTEEVIEVLDEQKTNREDMTKKINRVEANETENDVEKVNDDIESTEDQQMPTSVPTVKPEPTMTPVATEETVTWTPEPTTEAYVESTNVGQEQTYVEPVYEEPSYEEAYVEPTYSDTSWIDQVRAQYNGNYAGTPCENIVALYTQTSLIYGYDRYLVDSPQAGDAIMYFDSGWNYRHAAVYLGDGLALHGSYNADKSAQVASMYISGYPYMFYMRSGGGSNFACTAMEIGRNNGGSGGWLSNAGISCGY